MRAVRRAELTVRTRVAAHGGDGEFEDGLGVALWIGLPASATGATERSQGT
jgi:hypothetical protein